MANDQRQRRGCFLFYVYGFFLGLGCGVISAIFAFAGSEPATDTSQYLIVTACVLSCVTFTTQLAIACRGERSAGQRSASIVLGLFITTCATIAALATSPGDKGIFFMGGTFSAVLYLFTIVAFSVNFARDRKYHRETEARAARDRAATHRLRNAYSQSDISTLAFGAGFPDSLAAVDHITYNNYYSSGAGSGDGADRRDAGIDSQRGQALLPMNELLMLGIPPNIALPAYSETPPTVAGSGETQRGPPPSYSDIPNFSLGQEIQITPSSETGPIISVVTSHQPSITDSPPSYFEIETHM